MTNLLNHSIPFHSDIFYLTLFVYILWGYYHNIIWTHTLLYPHFARTRLLSFLSCHLLYWHFINLIRFVFRSYLWITAFLSRRQKSGYSTILGQSRCIWSKTRRVIHSGKNCSKTASPTVCLLHTAYEQYINQRNTDPTFSVAKFRLW